MTYDICMPDYDNSILGIPVSILKYYGIPSHHKSLPELDEKLKKAFKNIVFFVFDGMGADILDNHLSKTSFLQSHKLKDISSVFPCTTVAATKTMYTGLTPKEHGWIGWHCYFKEHDKYIELFKNTDYYTKEKIDIPRMENGYLAYETIGQKIEKKTNSKVKAYDILTNKVAFGTIETIKELFSHIRDICNNNDENFIQAYWTDPDSFMHDNGCYHQDVKKILDEINNNAEIFANEIKDTLIIITADHGHLDIKEDIYLNDFPEIIDCFLRAPAFERRSMTFFIKDGMEDEFKEKFNNLFGDDFILLNKENYIKNFLGEGETHQRIDDFVGNFVALATTNKTLSYRANDEQKINLFKGHHAGLTSKEMIVPLIVIET